MDLTILHSCTLTDISSDMKIFQGIIVITSLAVMSVEGSKHGKGGKGKGGKGMKRRTQVQLGPRPYYLVGQMLPSDLKTKLGK